MTPTAMDPQGGGSFDVGLPSTSTVTRKLLWANGIVFVCTVLLLKFAPSIGMEVWDWLKLDPNTWYGRFPAVWQLWTYGFLHSLSTPFHLLFNLLALYFFGTMLEAMVGPRRFAWQYFAALAFGALVHLLLSPLLTSDGLGYPTVVGASGAVLYTVIACATLRPDARVLFFFVPMPMKVMALILVGLDLFTVLTDKDSLTASWVHLAGAALGFAAVRLHWVYFDPQAWWSARKRSNLAKAEASDARRLDDLLARIHREGIHSLSQRDKDFLSRRSKRN